MTYARSRLWLGISGVGAIVVATQTLLLLGGSSLIFSTSHQWSSLDIASVLLFEALIVAFMFPLDVLGGLILPRLFGRRNVTVRRLFYGWLGGVARAVHCNVGRPELWVMLPTD